MGWSTPSTRPSGGTATSTGWPATSTGSSGDLPPWARSPGAWARATASPRPLVAPGTPLGRTGTACLSGGRGKMVLYQVFDGIEEVVRKVLRSFTFLALLT